MVRTSSETQLPELRNEEDIRNTGKNMGKKHEKAMFMGKSLENMEKILKNCHFNVNNYGNLVENMGKSSVNGGLQLEKVSSEQSPKRYVLIHQLGWKRLAAPTEIDFYTATAQTYWTTRKRVKIIKMINVVI